MTTPAHAAGTVTVVVYAYGSSATGVNAFTYFIPPPPAFTDISPIYGPITGGNTVTITGRNMSYITGVAFDGTAATGVTVINSTAVTAVAPAHAAGTVDVNVTNAGGTSTGTHAYTYGMPPAPSFTGIAPSSGLTTGGTVVSITGTGFTAGSTGVTVGGTAATAVTVRNGTLLRATVPAHAAGAADVVVTTPGGSATGPNAFTYTLPLSAAFSGTPLSGTTPLTVSFTDASTGNPTGWNWIFGDGSWNQAWTQVNASPAWTARDFHTSVALPDGSIVLMGGQDDDDNKNDTWRSTDKGKTWVLMNASSGWAARIGHTSVAMPDGSIVLMGGYGGTPRNDTWRSTDKGATWSLMNASSGWEARTYFSSAAMPDGSIVLLGGPTLASQTGTNDVWRSTDNGATWVLVNPGAAWGKRIFPNLVALPDGTLVLMGGTDLVISVYNDTWRSVDRGVTWTEANASSGWGQRFGQNCVAMPDGSIVLMGGKLGDRFNDTWRSVDQGATWTRTNASAGWIARDISSSVALPDGNIVLMGGEDGNVLRNDTWLFSPVGSSAQNPSHTYTAAGTYPVTLIVSNASGYSAANKAGYITVSWDPAVEPGWQVPAGGTVYIGESGLNISRGAGTNTTIAWFRSGISGTATVPNKTLDVTGVTHAFTVAPADFNGYNGTWYSWTAGKTKGGSPVAFNVTNATAINLTVTDATTGLDANGRTIPVGDQIAFSVSATTLDLAGRGIGTTPVRIIVTAPGGTVSTTLTNRAGTVTPLALSLSSSTYATGTIWDTENRLYPTGQYNITAIYDLNHMAENNPAAGRTVAVYRTMNLSATAVPIQAPPAITAVAPASGYRNTTAGFSITGTNFVPGSTTVEFRNGSTVLSPVLATVTATRIDGTLAIPAGTTTGPWNIRVITTAGGENTLVGKYTIAQMARPAITSMTPSSGIRTGTVTFTMQGTNFQAGPGNTTVQLYNRSYFYTYGTNITARLASVSSTSITGNLTVPAESDLGKIWTVNVSTVGGGISTSRMMFEVTVPKRPTVTALAPAIPWYRNATINYSITGTNFQPGYTMVSFLNQSGSELNATSGAGVTSITPTRINGTIRIPANLSSPTPYNITVTTMDGGTGAKEGAITIADAPKPSFTAITPAGAWNRNATVSYSITGTNFQPGKTVITFRNKTGTYLNGTADAGMTSVTTTRINGSIHVPADAPTGAWNVSIATVDGGMIWKDAAFTVGNATKPSFTAITPAGAWNRNATVSYSITGTNFQPGKTVITFRNKTGTYLNGTADAGMTSVTTTRINGTIHVPSDAPAGSWNVSIATVDGGTIWKDAAFTVADATKPSFTAITPATAWSRNATINYSITGTSFQPGKTVITFQNKTGTYLNGTADAGMTSVTATRINGSIHVPADAPTGSWNVSIATLDGGTIWKDAAFTVADASKPSFTAITPATAWSRNATINYSITGTNFQPGRTVITFRNKTGTYLNGTADAGMTSVTTTRINGTIHVPSDAPAGAWNVSIATVDGGTIWKDAAFTVGNATKPAFTAITPSGMWSRNATISYSITGTGFQPGNTVITFRNKTGTYLNGTADAGMTSVTATRINGSIHVPADAPTGSWNVSIATVDGGTTWKDAAFTVAGAEKPAFTAIAPAGPWYRNATVSYTITGTGFQPGDTVVTFRNSTGSVLNATSGAGVSSVTRTKISGTVVVPYEASSKSPWNASIQTVDGGTIWKAAAFTVSDFPRPTITTLTPSTGYPNSTVSVTVKGTNFQPGQTTAVLTNPAYGTLPVTVYSTSSTEVVAGFTLPANAVYGTWKLNVTTADGGTASTAFAVKELPAPKITSFTPSSASRGTTVAFTVNGNYFQPGGRTTVTLTRAGQTAIPTTLTSVYPTRITGTAAIPSGAGTGDWKVTVATLDGGDSTMANAITIL